jgi:hypothetical protein
VKHTIQTEPIPAKQYFYEGSYYDINSWYHGLSGSCLRNYLGCMSWGLNESTTRNNFHKEYKCVNDLVISVVFTRQ